MSSVEALSFNDTPSSSWVRVLPQAVSKGDKLLKQSLMTWDSQIRCSIAFNSSSSPNEALVHIMRQGGRINRYRLSLQRPVWTPSPRAGCDECRFHYSSRLSPAICEVTTWQMKCATPCSTSLLYEQRYLWYARVKDGKQHDQKHEFDTDGIFPTFQGPQILIEHNGPAMLKA